MSSVHHSVSTIRECLQELCSRPLQVDDEVHQNREDRHRDKCDRDIDECERKRFNERVVHGVLLVPFDDGPLTEKRRYLGHGGECGKE